MGGLPGVLKENTSARDTWLLMTDMQETPPNSSEDLSSAQIPVQASDIEHLQLSSSLPSQVEPGESSEHSIFNAAFNTAGIKGLLPNARAQEERRARLKESRAKRRLGTLLTADEICDDLVKIITHLITQLGTHNAGMSIILKMPAQALLYAERTASYAINDYVRVFENDTTIISLWDALERICIAAADWRKDSDKGDGKSVIVSIERIAKAAIRGLHLADDAPPNEDAASDDSSLDT